MLKKISLTQACRVSALSLITAMTFMAATSVDADDKNKIKDKDHGKTKHKEHHDKEHHAGPIDAKSFIKKAAQVNLAEMQIGKMAAQKSQDPAVKDFSQMLVRDHQQALEKLQTLARQQQIELPTQLDPKHQKHMQKLEQASGREFNKEFAKHMLKDHHKAIAKFQRASQELEDPAVKQYAQETLPTLRHHLQAATDLARRVGLEESAITAAIREAETDAAGGAQTEPEIGTGEAGDEKYKTEQKQKNTEQNRELPRPR